MTTDDDMQFYSELLRAYFDSTNDAIFVLCDEMKFLSCNKTTQKWLGLSEQELTLHNNRIPITELFGYTNYVETFTKSFDQAVKGKDICIETYIIPKNGEARWIEISMTKVDIEAGDMVIAVARDISERKKHLAIIEHQAYYDSLTGLPNKQALTTYIQDRAKENITDENPLTLFCLDLDKFKEVNESLGQGIGDAILQEISAKLKHISDSNMGEMLARMGGDEFALVIPNINLIDANNIAKKIKSIITSPISIASSHIVLDCSIGIVSYPTHTSNSKILIQLGEATMYSAKSNHTGISIYDPEIARMTSQRIQMVADLRYALKNNHIKPHYQPIININNPEIVHIETLARWETPSHDFVSAEIFIRLAEENNLINDLTTQIINQSIAECSSIINDKTINKLSINISPYCLTSKKLSETIKSALDKNSVPADKITFEITESAMMSTLSNTKEIIKKIHRLGIDFSIDDFGTGHSALFKLKQLPLTELKIDKTFIQDIINNSDDAAITHASIQMAHSLDLYVLAEGIEDEAIWNILKKFGCDYGQGFWLAKPMPIHELKLWLENFDRKKLI
ncbi:MAG: EAL domain-containing protein [Gammaproteobacteria bacterium]|nr:EAL domain-containing protein [Gammaproteobacteria bacterium]